jgi:hypothetical protein
MGMAVERTKYYNNKFPMGTIQTPMKKLLLGIAVIAVFSGGGLHTSLVPAEGMSSQMITDAENTGYGPNLHGNYDVPFLLFTPPDAVATMTGLSTRKGLSVKGKKYPLIIHMHGIGERSRSYSSPSAMGTADLPDLYVTGPPPLMRNSSSPLYDKRFAAPGKTDSTEFFWIFPQVYGGIGGNASDAADYAWLMYGNEILKWCHRNLPDIIDYTRVYVAGLSFGGGWVWVTVQDSLLNKQIAAGVPIAPGYLTYTGLHLTGTPGNNDPYNFGLVARSRIPMYGIHALNDPTTPKPSGTTDGAYISNRCFDSIAKYKAGGSWIYRKRTTGGHNVWDAAWNPTYENTSIQLVNGQSYTQSPPIQSWLLQWSTKGRRHMALYVFFLLPVMKRTKTI